MQLNGINGDEYAAESKYQIESQTLFAVSFESVVVSANVFHSFLVEQKVF